MGTTPEIDNKPKYNKSKPYQWVDSQWEKFMLEQKELKSRIVELEIENTDLKEKLMTLFPDEETKWIYESPDGGETLYRRKFGDYDNKELVNNQLELFD